MNTKMMKKIYHILFLVSIGANAQFFSAEQITQDLSYLAKEMERSIPCLHEYNPDFTNKANHLISTINSSMKLMDLYALGCRMAALGNEGHINTYDWNSPLLNGFASNEYLYLPFSIKIFNEGIYIDEVYADIKQLNKGIRIHAINEIPILEIINKIEEHIPSDGVISTYSKIKVEEGFNWLYYLFISQDSIQHISIADQGTSNRLVSVEATSLEKMRSYMKSRGLASSTPKEPVSAVYEFTINPDYALLKLKSFDWRSLENEKLSPKKLYTSIFTQLKEKRAHNLIVDLRGNTGGRNEFADEIIPYINKRNKTESFKTTISWEGKVKEYIIPKPNKLLFTGTIIVLVDGKTYSAGASIARFFKEYGEAFIIGEETGTRYEGFAGGSSNKIILPNSQIIFYLPRYHIKYQKSTLQMTTNRGLIPDFIITPDKESWLTQTDTPLLMAIQKIQSQKD
jgi:hypothetical protein